MRLKITAVLAIVLGIVALAPGWSSAAFFCDTYFTVFGKTDGQHSLLFFRVYKDGDCEMSRLTTLYLDPTRASVMGTRSTDLGLGQMDSLLSGLQLEPMEVLPCINGRIKLSDQAFMTPPATDTSFDRKYYEITKHTSGDAGSWYKECPAGCSDYPEFHGCNARLLYTLDDGLYKNYQLDTAYWFQKSGFLVVTTRQPKTHDGGVTMDGLLVFQVNMSGESLSEVPVEKTPDSTHPDRGAPSTDSGQFATQRYALFDKTVGDHCLMFFREDWDKKGRSTFVTLFVLPDRVHSFTSDRLVGNWVPRLYANMNIESYVALLPDSMGVIRLDDTTWFGPPPFDSTFSSKFQSLKKQDLKTWRWEHTDDASDMPAFGGACPEYIFPYEGGLYKNYRLREARYYAASDLIVLLTEQSLRDEEGRSMNGLIIVNVHGFEEYADKPCGK